MEDKERNERNGYWTFTYEELKGKTVIQEVATRSLKHILDDLEKSGIVIRSSTKC